MFDDGLSGFFRNIVDNLLICTSLYALDTLEKKGKNPYVIYSSWYSLFSMWELNGNVLTLSSLSSFMASIHRGKKVSKRVSMEELTLTVGLHSRGRQRRILGRHTLKNNVLNTECGKEYRDTEAGMAEDTLDC